MNNRKNYQFMYLDLAFFSILAMVSEWMANGLLDTLGSSFYFSFANVLCLISMIRWGIPGIVTGLFGGIPEILFSGMTLGGGMLYCVLANSFLGVPILIYGNRRRDEISRCTWLLILYVFAAHVCLAVGKGIAITLLTGAGNGFRLYFGSGLLITVIDVIICLVLRTRQGLLADMQVYFEKGEERTDEKQQN